MSLSKAEAVSIEGRLARLETKAEHVERKYDRMSKYLLVAGGASMSALATIALKLTGLA